jgi:predicted component of viral defense system (DUF524 family)
MENFDGKLVIDLGHLAANLKIEFKDAEERFHVSEDFEQRNEAKYQFSEGVFYAYSIFEEIDSNRKKSDWKIDTDGALKGVIKPFSKTDGSEGMFAPNTFVGTLPISLVRDDQKIEFHVEVHSSKIDYKDKNLQNKLGEFRSEYQLMIEDIAEHSIELVLQYNVPIQQSFESGLEQLDDEKELYQRFLFVRSLFKNQEFEESVQKIISNPATRWITEEEDRDIRSIRRFTPKNIRELTSRANRMPFSGVIPGLNDVPLKISSSRKIESVDTPENRFIKHILESFLLFCETIESKLEKAKLNREYMEVRAIGQRVENLLNQPFFQDINRPTSLRINSPVLQRRSGYRELLRAWLRFHLTAQLSWKFDNDQDNLFSGGKKDIASLYEYWVFFVLFNTLSEKYGQFTTKDPDKWIDGLIVPDKHGLGLTLQEGKTRAFEFTYQSVKRKLNIKFYYNRPFAGGKIYNEDKSAGSYSKSFRPDYTLSIWPSNMSQSKAEETESIVHVHFDAKYKVEYSFIKEEKPDIGEELIVPDRENVSEEEKKLIEEQIASASVSAREQEEKKGIFKNVDLYKMHAYKDAIRRSGGAYILYPGNIQENKEFKGFHEIIPGVGAFALRPNNEGQASKNIQEFIDKVITNLEDVLSQREQMARATKNVYETEPIEKIVDPKLETLLRELGNHESPQDTIVLVGYYKGEEHLKWIEANSKYNVRYGVDYPIDGKMITAKYLVLYGNNDMEHAFIYPINTEKGRICSKKELFDFTTKKYPSTPSSAHYFIFDLGHRINLDSFMFDMENEILKDKLKELEKTKMPFTISLLELAKIRSLRTE